MARIIKPPPGRLIVSIMYTTMDALADGLTSLEKKFGRVQFETLEIECDQAKQYKEEMGRILARRFYSFDKMVPRDFLPEAKTCCHKIETQLADTVDGYPFRAVNVDPGILSPTALIMASHREQPHRIYMRDGVYGELTLIHAHDKFCRLPWTESDYCDDEAITFFERVRQTFDLLQPIEVEESAP